MTDGTLISFRTTPRWRRAITTAVLAAAGTLVSGCGSSQATQVNGRVTIIAAENFWGSIARQVGGEHASVTSIITNPDTDPHSYEPTASDARGVATAQYVIVNGAGYDPWFDHLLQANPTSGRIALNVASIGGRVAGDNPHMWYSPTIVVAAVHQMAGDLSSLDPADATYFAQQATAFIGNSLRSYDELRASIRSTYHGIAVGATESIVVDLCSDLGLNLVTPPSYMRAISEGNDPSAADKQTVDQQITQHTIKILVYNKQNATPDIQFLIDRANTAGIPVVAVTETLSPANATFQGWQTTQLTALQAALQTAVAA